MLDLVGIEHITIEYLRELDGCQPQCEISETRHEQDNNRTPGNPSETASQTSHDSLPLFAFVLERKWYDYRGSVDQPTSPNSRRQNVNPRVQKIHCRSVSFRQRFGW